MPSASAGSHQSPQAHSNLVSGVAELTLETTDLAEAERFYHGLLGLPLLSRDDDRIWMAAGEDTGLGVWSPGRKEFGDRGGRHVHFAFSVTAGRLDELTDRLRAAAVDVRGPVEHDGGDRSIYFEDPAGNLVEAWDFLGRGEGKRDGVAALA